MHHLFTYALHLADNSLILGQRNAEWTGHGPVLEQDIAITNISLDLIGQARNFYQYAVSVFNKMSESEKQHIDKLLPRPWKSFNRPLEEDDLAMLRDENQYRNLLICELPKGDWAYTTLRQFFFSTYQYFLFQSMVNGPDKELAAIAEKSLKETAYHVRWSGEWVIRLGDGTDESRARILTTLTDVWMFTGEMFEDSDFENEMQSIAIQSNSDDIRKKWKEKINSVFSEAGLELPQAPAFQSGGKHGVHTEYMGYLLSEMQYLQRTFPNATW